MYIYITYTYIYYINIYIYICEPELVYKYPRTNWQEKTPSFSSKLGTPLVTPFDLRF